MQQWIQIIVFIVVIGGPILGQFLQWLGKQKKAKDRERAVEAARLEALRTGRPFEEVLGVKVAQQQQARQQQAQQSQTMTQSERMAELARRRQEQIQELRRRQEAARQQQAQARTTPAPGPARPRVPGAVARPAQTTPRSSPQPRPAQAQRPPTRPAPGRPGPTQPQQRARPAARPAPARPAPAQPTPPTRGGTPQPPAYNAPQPTQAALGAGDVPASPATGAPAVRTISLLGHPMTAADWRRFIVARELLDPPLALREPEDLPSSA